MHPAPEIPPFTKKDTDEQKEKAVLLMHVTALHCRATDTKGKARLGRGDEKLDVGGEELCRDSRWRQRYMRLR